MRDSWGAPLFGLDAFALERRFTHKRSNGLVVRVNLPLGNTPLPYNRAPRRGHLPVAYCCILPLWHVPPTRRAPGENRISFSEHVCDVDSIVWHHLEVCSEARGHLIAAANHIAERVDESMIVGQEIRYSTDFATVDCANQRAHDSEGTPIITHVFRSSPGFHGSRGARGAGVGG